MAEWSDDPVVALHQAVALYSADRFERLAELVGDEAAAERITQTADIFIAWLRRPKKITLGPPTIEEQPPKGPLT